MDQTAGTYEIELNKFEKQCLTWAVRTAVSLGESADTLRPVGDRLNTRAMQLSFSRQEGDALLVAARMHSVATDNAKAKATWQRLSAAYRKNWRDLRFPA